MVWIRRGFVSVASDTTTALLINTRSSQTRAAITALLSAEVKPLVVGAIAEDGTVAEAAAEAAASAVAVALEDADVVRFQDPAVPKEGRFEDDSGAYLRELDELGNVSRQIRADGTQHLPKADSDRLSIGGGDRLERPVDGSGYLFRVHDGEKMTELAVDQYGNFADWVLKRWANRMGIDAGGASTGYDIILILGQSNAAAAAHRLYAEAFREEDSRISQLVSGQSALTVLPARDVNLGAEFARAYLRNRAVTGRRVLVVQAALGSTGFTTTSLDPAPEGYTGDRPGTWDRTLTSDPVNLYSRAISAATDALALAGAGSRLVAAAWVQGEDDASRLSTSQYAAKLDDLITQMRADLGVPDLPFVIGSLVPAYTAISAARQGIVRALSDTPRRTARTAFVYGPDGVARMGEAIHFAFQAQIMRGELFSTVGLTEAMLNQVDREPVPPSALRVRRMGGQAVIEWDRPWCHVDTLTVDYSTDAGETWQTATVDGLHGSRSEPLTVSPATALHIRATSTNAQGVSEAITTVG